MAADPEAGARGDDAAPSGVEPSGGPAVAPRSARWTRAVAASDLPEGAMKGARVCGHHVLLVHDEREGVLAVEGRCPHEGYPLATGERRGRVLTCAWHNWKFDLRDGRCLLGGEGLRTYPVRRTADQLEVDLTDPDPAAGFTARLDGIGAALRDGDVPRAVRESVRLLHAGFGVERLLAELGALDARRGEYGVTHALPVAADLARLGESHPGVAGAHLAAPVMELIADESARLPDLEEADPRSGGDEATLRAAVEAEDAARAEGLLLGALDAGARPEDVERWLFGALADHFLGFGHPLIYHVKAGELLRRAGFPEAPTRAVLRGVLRATVFGTREDTLPYLRRYREAWDALVAEFPAWESKRDPSAPVDLAAVSGAVLDGSAEDAVSAVAADLRRGVHAESVAAALAVAGARRLLRFDESLETDPSVAENWLWATHRFTFASAVRNAASRYRGPDRARFLFHAVAFLHSGKPMDRPGGEPRVEPAPEFNAAALREAVRRADPESAMALARAALRGGGVSAAELEREMVALSYRQARVRPIHLAHTLKTASAAFEERAAWTAPGGVAARDPAIAELPVVAAVRYLASPAAERRLDDQVDAAIRFVVDGEIPRKRTQ